MVRPILRPGGAERDPVHDPDVSGPRPTDGRRITQVAGLEQARRPRLVLRAENHAAATQPAGDGRGIRYAQDFDAVGRLVLSEGDPQFDVVLQLGRQLALQRLRGQHQVHAQRPAFGRDVDQCPQEVRGRLQYPGELIEDHNKAGERGQPGCIAPGPPVLVDLTAVPGEQGLPAAHLRPYRGEDPVGGSLVEDVRRCLAGGADEPDDVRAALEREERAAALEVDEDEVQLVGGVGQ